MATSLELVSIHWERRASKTKKGSVQKYSEWDNLNTRWLRHVDICHPRVLLWDVGRKEITRRDTPTAK